MNSGMRKKLARGMRKNQYRLRDIEWEDQSHTMLAASNIKYDLADKARRLACGGIGVIHTLARQSGLIDAIDRRLHPLKIHKPYHESDHVLNIAYNLLCGGQCLEPTELRRDDQVFADALGAQRISDPTTAGDFCRRFKAHHVETLNRATNGSALSCSSVSNPIFTNCTFTGNRGSRGGAVFSSILPHVTYVNCTFTGNTAAEFGGAMYHVQSNATIQNSILWGNTAGTAGGQIGLVRAETFLTVTNSDVQGGPDAVYLEETPQVLWEQDNVDADLNFVNAAGADGIIGTADDDSRLTADSAGRDNGNNFLVPQDIYDLDGDGDTTEPIPFDLDGQARFVNDDIDMGAYEYADCNENGVNDHTDIADGTSPDVNGNGVPDDCDSCLANAKCADNKVCTFDVCGQSGCTHVSARYGDVAGSPGTCGPDGDVSLVDILAVLDGFQNVFADGCDLSNVDMASPSDGCVGDGAIDLPDILAILDAFQGTTTCCPGQR